MTSAGGAPTGSGGMAGPGGLAGMVARAVKRPRRVVRGDGRRAGNAYGFGCMATLLGFFALVWTRRRPRRREPRRHS